MSKNVSGFNSEDNNHKTNFILHETNSNDKYQFNPAAKWNLVNTLLSQMELDSVFCGNPCHLKRSFSMTSDASTDHKKNYDENFTISNAISRGCGKCTQKESTINDRRNVESTNDRINSNVTTNGEIDLAHDANFDSLLFYEFDSVASIGDIL